MKMKIGNNLDKITPPNRVFTTKALSLVPIKVQIRNDLHIAHLPRQLEGLQFSLGEELYIKSLEEYSQKFVAGEATMFQGMEATRKSNEVRLRGLAYDCCGVFKKIRSVDRRPDPRSLNNWKSVNRIVSVADFIEDIQGRVIEAIPTTIKCGISALHLFVRGSTHTASIDDAQYFITDRPVKRHESF